MAQFFLRSSRTSGEAPLYTKIRRNGFQLYVCTGINVDIQEWNKSQKSMAALKRYEATPAGMKVHNLQVEVMNAIDSLYSEKRIKSKEDKELVEKTISSIVNGTVEEIQERIMVNEGEELKYIHRYYDYFFAGISDGSIRHGNNAVYSEGSVGVWKCFGDYLKVYCKKNMLFSQIDKPFADRFTLFLERKGLMMHTVNKHVSCFRKLCNLAAMEGYNSNAVSLRVWKDKTVKEEEKRKEIYLTDEEIDGMYKMELTGMEEKVRDIFLLGYFSCQRYSDYSELKKKNFITYNKELGIITLTQKKTGREVCVPIVDDRVYELCNKYHYVFPTVTEQQLNEKIKVVAQKLSATMPSMGEKEITVLTSREKSAEETYSKLLKKKKAGVKFTENERKRFGKLNKVAMLYGGETLYERNKDGEVIRPKFQLVSSHTSRRSGVTNMYKMGILSNIEMRSITGHRSEKVFETYIKVSKAEQAQQIAQKLKAAKVK